jgi:hypothetical protein
MSRDQVTMKPRWVLLACLACGAAGTAQDSPLSATEAMIPMRDGVRLSTQMYAPKQSTEPLPIIVLRTPYGTGSLNPSRIATALAHLLADGNVIVQQDIRGRFKSEGTFVMLRQPRDRHDATIRAGDRVHHLNDVLAAPAGGWHTLILCRRRSDPGSRGRPASLRNRG